MIPLDKLHSVLQKNKIPIWSYLITFFLILIVSYTTISMVSVPVFAENITTARSYGKQIASLITSIFNPSAVLCFGLALVKIVLSKNTKDVEDGMKWAKSIIIAFVIFNIGGTFMNWVDTIPGMNHSYKYKDSTLNQAINEARQATKAMLPLFSK